MGDDGLLDHQIFKRLYPIRKFVFVASILLIVLSFMVVVECVFILTTDRFSNSVPVSFSYFLATFLVLVGLIGLRYSYMSSSSSVVDNNDQPIIIESPGTSPLWLTTNMPHFSDRDLLPGIVCPDGIYTLPPPRYSSLGDVTEHVNVGQRCKTSSNHTKFNYPTFNRNSRSSSFI